jgi:hypothetical protein
MIASASGTLLRRAMCRNVEWTRCPVRLHDAYSCSAARGPVRAPTNQLKAAISFSSSAISFVLSDICRRSASIIAYG